MSINKFKKPQFQAHYFPEDAYDHLFNIGDLVPNVKSGVFSFNDKDILFNHEPFLTYKNGLYTFEECDFKDKEINLEPGTKYRPSQLLNLIKFKGNYLATRNYILTNYLDYDVPFVKISGLFYKIIYKPNRYGVKIRHLIPYNVTEITREYDKKFVEQRIPIFDDFTIEPSNTDYQQTVGNFYNLYHPFTHKPFKGNVTISDIPTTAAFMAHVFGDQLELGWQYLKILYENPKQILPVLVLVSKDRQTGKTTFLNYINMIFGDNNVTASSNDFQDSFNAHYAYANIVSVDETFIEKKQAIERIKFLATTKSIVHRRMYKDGQTIPFYGKIIMATNNVSDFMRIDSEEIRFWVRKLDKIEKFINNIEDKLFAEIPKMLTYIKNLDAIQNPHSRMVFTAEQIRNVHLDLVVSESKSSLYKELHNKVCDFMIEENVTEFYATINDIMDKWFERNNRVSNYYLSKVLREEFKLTSELSRQRSFKATIDNPGRYYHFKCTDFGLSESDIQQASSYRNTSVTGKNGKGVQNIGDDVSSNNINDLLSGNKESPF